MSAAPPEIEPVPNPISERLPSRDGYGGVPRSAARGVEIVAAVLVVIGMVLIGTLVIGAIDPTIADDDPSDGGALGLQAIFELSFAFAAIGAATIANRHGIADALRRLGLRRPAGPVLSTGLIALGAYAVSALILNALLEPEQKDIAESLGAGKDSALLVTIVAGILIAPVTAFCEEIFFRGLIFGGIRQRLPLWPAAVASGLFFGVLHLTSGDLGVALQLSALGIIFAWAYERSGTLWVPIGLHLLNNTLAFVLLIS